MKRFRRLQILFGVTASAGVLALATVVPAQGATATGWRVLHRHHYGAATNFSAYVTGVATSKHNAWAFGGTNVSGATPGAPVAEHWNGKVWRGSSLPPGLTGNILAASASAGSNVWAVTHLGGIILHWNGTRWSVAKHVPGGGRFSGVTAVSSKDVWVFGGPGETSGLGTWHFNGHTWTNVTGNADGLEVASALSASNIWGIGSSIAPGNLIMHFTHSWQRVTASALSNLLFRDILAESAKNVWVTATAFGNSLAPRLVHFNGTRWTRVAPPPWAVDPNAIVSDGRGGLWISAEGSNGHGWILHRSATGHWQRSALANVGLGVNLALIPGTEAVLAFGSIQVNNNSDAVVWGHGKSA
ncbi:MAG TPA: hypothetical protein VH641_02620 [Streptosporangiaceae bacterium]|jgi:hypothetical protein